MEGPPLGPGGEDITWPDQVAPRGRKASSTRKIKPQTSNHLGVQSAFGRPDFLGKIWDVIRYIKEKLRITRRLFQS